MLKHVSFHAPAGSTTALVGSSGSGKSTLISLVMTFNRPHDGPRAGRRPRSDRRSSCATTARHLGVVLQDNFLFDGTIAENIAYARPHATREEIKAVSQIAHCDEFIESFEQQYDTIVGERGVRLSGGQRQRVAIARAILADPRVLILDEATSSLDSESEAMIQDGLRSLRRGRTTFVIAHRLSTIRSADQILVLEHGEIVERGTHDELLAQRRALPAAVRQAVPLREATASSTRARISRRSPRRWPHPRACRIRCRDREVRRSSFDVRRSTFVVRRCRSIRRRGSSFASTWGPALAGPTISLRSSIRTAPHGRAMYCAGPPETFETRGRPSRGRAADRVRTTDSTASRSGRLRPTISSPPPAPEAVHMRSRDCLRCGDQSAPRGQRSRSVFASRSRLRRHDAGQ